MKHFVAGCLLGAGAILCVVFGAPRLFGLPERGSENLRMSRVLQSTLSDVGGIGDRVDGLAEDLAYLVQLVGRSQATRESLPSVTAESLPDVIKLADGNATEAIEVKRTHDGILL